MQLNQDKLTNSVEQKSQIKIATFNLFNYLAPPNAYYEFERIYSQEQWQKKQRWIATYLQFHAPDIIGFQEVFSLQSLQDLTKQQGYEYFAAVDEPTVVDDFIYRDPVVSIASKFPIIDVQPVTVDQALASKLGLSADFAFSRLVVRATINVPHIGACDCYVVHFKSKRPAWSSELPQTVASTVELVNAFQDQVAGGWASSIQRGSEAALLQSSMLARRLSTGNAMILMGDFNTPISDGVLAHLISPKLNFNNNTSDQRVIAQYRLHDAWDLFVNNQVEGEDSLQRPATHYFGQNSSVLDYILLSSEFDARGTTSYFEVSDYINTDRHLINPDFAIDGESTDHAVVSIELTLRE